jgi:hypothetical protein
MAGVSYKEVFYWAGHPQGTMYEHIAAYTEMPVFV